MNVLLRNNVSVLGREDGPAIMFAHGFGCDQSMWRYVSANFEEEYKVVLFDYVGLGKSDISAYDRERYDSLSGYASDVLEILEALDLSDVTFVGHSVSSMIGVIAAIEQPNRIGRLILVGPSARYINDEISGYNGGFSREDIDGLLQSLASNYLGWSQSMAPAIVGNPDRPHLGAELTESFCRADPAIAHQFACVTFLSDNRDDLAKVKQPTLVLQCSDDIIAGDDVGKYVASKIASSEFVHLRATGHCPNLSAPEETTAAIKAFLREASVV